MKPTQETKILEQKNTIREFITNIDSTGLEPGIKHLKKASSNKLNFLTRHCTNYNKMRKTI